MGIGIKSKAYIEVNNQNLKEKKMIIVVILYRQICEIKVHWGDKTKKVSQDDDLKTLIIAYMVDYEDTSSTWNTSPTHKKQRAKRKHAKHM